MYMYEIILYYDSCTLIWVMIWMFPKLNLKAITKLFLLTQWQQKLNNHLTPQTPTNSTCGCLNAFVCLHFAMFLGKKFGFNLNELSLSF